MAEMELEPNIFFNTDKLVENDTVKISYMGYFFQRGDEQVTLHYGFGNEWHDQAEIEMEKTELGFQAKFQIVGTDELHLCFKSGKGDWDNKFGQNFNFEVKPCEKALAVIPNQQEMVSYKLTPSYIFFKKVKLAFYKTFKYIPRILGFGKYSAQDDMNY